MSSLMPDTQDDRQRALELWRWRQAQTSIMDRDDRGGIRAGTAVGTAQFLGAPVDIVNSLLQVAGMGSEEPLGGSINIQRGLSKIGLAPEVGTELTRGGEVGRLLGLSAPGALGIVGLGARSLAANIPSRGILQKPVTQPATASEVGVPSNLTRPGVTTSILQDVARTAQTSPTAFAAGETAAATGAGLLSYEAQQRFPGSPGAQALAEIAGGAAPALATAGTRFTAQGAGWLAKKLPVSGLVVRTVRATWNQLSTSAQTRRAMQRVRRAIGPEEGSGGRAVANIERTDILEDSGLSLAAKTGDKDLMALERSIVDADPELRARYDEQLAFTNNVIRESMMSVGADEVSIAQAKEYFAMLLESRMRLAATKVDDAMAKLGPNATREDLNALARRELEQAKIDSRAHEKQLYAAIPEKAVVPTDASREIFENFRLSTPKAQREDLPKVAVDLLTPTIKGPKGKPVKNPNYLGANTTIEEMRGLQSKLRETARIARSEQRFNAARIADDIADAITDDIGNAMGGAEVRETVDVAVEFSRIFNDRFTRGAVGKLLGLERTGGPRVDPQLTLESTVGLGGPRAKVATDKLLDAVNLRGDEPAMSNHIQAFLIDDFRRTSVKDGLINTKAGERWMANNQDVLNRFPELRRDLNAAIRAGGELQDINRAANPEVSRAAVFVNADLGKEIPRMLATSNPRQAARDLLKVARQDPTGVAEKGVKAAFFDYLMQTSLVQGRMAAQFGNIPEQSFLSGAALTRALERDPVREFAVGLLTPSEVRRLQQIRQTATLLDKWRNATPASEGIIGDMPNVLWSLVGRVGGAQVGRWIAGMTGGGTVQTPGILAAQVQKLLMAGVRDPAKRMLTDAIQDESLFRALLVPQAYVEPRVAAAANARINAWVLDVLAEQHQYEED